MSTRTARRGLLAVALVLLFTVTPVAGAQTQANPIVGSFAEIYVLSGRAVDGQNNPIAGGTVWVNVQQRGVTSEPFPVATNCYGDFIATFNIRHIDATGRAEVFLAGSTGGVSNVSKEVRLDSFYRRSDVTLRAEGNWTKACPDQAQYWPGRVTVTGRIVNRTDPYEVEGTTYHAKPYVGFFTLRFYDENGTEFCPPSGEGDTTCEVLFTDERGDFRYSFTFPYTKSAEGRTEVRVGTTWFNATNDGPARIATHHIELTGQGPPGYSTPGPAALVTLVAVGLALAGRVVSRRP